MTSKKDVHKQQAASTLNNDTDFFAGITPHRTIVTSQLYFRTNSNTILPFLKSKAGGASGHALFSLNSIVPLPQELLLPLDKEILQLALLNIAIPIIDEAVKSNFLTGWTTAYTGKQPPAVITEAVTVIRKKMHGSHDHQQNLEVLEKAVENYKNTGFFCHFDWCMEHWGTSQDIQDVTEATFDLPTSFIEFQTVATPPLIALQQLSNTFPSVLFTVLYKSSSLSTWNEVRFYPFPPFGY